MKNEQLGECIDRIDTLLSKADSLPDVVCTGRRARDRAMPARLSRGGRGAAAEAGSRRREQPGQLIVEQSCAATSWSPVYCCCTICTLTIWSRELAEAPWTASAHSSNPMVATYKLVEIADGVVSLRLQGNCHGCPSSAMTLRIAPLSRPSTRRPPICCASRLLPDTAPPATGGFCRKSGKRDGISAGRKLMTAGLDVSHAEHNRAAMNRLREFAHRPSAHPRPSRRCELCSRRSTRNTSTWSRLPMVSCTARAWPAPCYFAASPRHVSAACRGIFASCPISK